MRFIDNNHCKYPMLRSLSIAMLLTLSFAALSFAEEATFTTAIIVYEYSGGGAGTETVYFDKANNRINQESTVTWTMGGATKVKESREMFDGKLFYTFDFDNNLVISEPVNNPDALAAMFPSPAEYGVPAGGEQVLGRECKLFQGTLMSGCFWNGIPIMESISNTFSPELNHAKKAVDIQLDVPIPEEKFQVSSDMRVLNPQQALMEMQEMFKRKR